MALTLHIPVRLESHLPFKAQEARVQRSGMFSLSSGAEWGGKPYPSALQTRAFSTPNTPPPKVTSTCPSASRYVHFRAKSWFSLESPVRSAGHAPVQPAGPQLLGWYYLQGVIALPWKYNDVQFVRIMILREQKWLLELDATKFYLRGHKRWWPYCSEK